MTAPDNNDAALEGTESRPHRSPSDLQLVREARELAASIRLTGGASVLMASLLEDLAATAERADELTARNQFLSTEQVRADTAEAALLAAQQNATRWQNRATLLGQERQRAEATNTRLREALQRIADGVMFNPPEKVMDFAAAALAQDAEQEPA